MSTVVIYTSIYGSTEKYAHWIADALECEAKKLSDIQPSDIVGFDTIIYGGGLYASGIAGFKKFLSKLGQPGNKKLILYMVGMTNPEQEELYAEVASKNIPLEWKGQIKVFALRGDQLFSKMSFAHKLMMKMRKSAIAKKPLEQRMEDDNAFLESIGKDTYLSSQDSIFPLVEYARSAT